MWSSKLARAGLLALAVAGATALSACSGFMPVYGERGIGVEKHAFRYARPENRLEQVIYQDLALRLGRSADPAAPEVRLVVTSATRALTRSNVARPAAEREVTVTSRIEIVGADGAVVFAATRSAAAPFTIDRQGLSEFEAERQAREQAALALADTVRLTLIGALARPAG
ncbi:MAG: hypothetical protein IPK28_12890 [Devosia sp.]|nr:hypothetical protein [Devosia sp.]